MFSQRSEYHFIASISTSLFHLWAKNEKNTLLTQNLSLLNCLYFISFICTRIRVVSWNATLVTWCSTLPTFFSTLNPLWDLARLSEWSSRESKEARDEDQECNGKFSLSSVKVFFCSVCDTHITMPNVPVYPAVPLFHANSERLMDNETIIRILEKAPRSVKWDFPSNNPIYIPLL